MESWLSGRKHLTANEAYGNVSGVRISHSPLVSNLYSLGVNINVRENKIDEMVNYNN